MTQELKKQPHVVFCVLDQCRPDRLAAHPIFEQLKQYSVFLDNVISYAPYTIASMHAIFSGIYGGNNGVDAYYKYEQFQRDRFLTMPEYFKKAGYYTVGDFINKMTSPTRGWDVHEIHDEYSDDLSKRHKAILQENLCRDKAFIYLHYSNIHTEMVRQVIKQFDDFDKNYFGNPEANKKRYDGFVKNAGDYLEGIWLEIKDKVLTGDVVFILITDHGCSMGEKEGEKAYGVYVYDYTIKVFHYFFAPKLLPVGMTNSSQLRTIDLLPTMLELLAIPPEEKEIPMDGRSYLQLLVENQRENRIAYAETGGLDGPFPSGFEPNVKTVRTGEWKLIYYKDNGKKSLYHIKEDPNEENDVSAENPKIMLKMWKLLLENQTKKARQ